MAKRNILQWMESLWSEHNLYPAIFFHRVLFALNQHSLLKKASGTVHSHKHSHILVFQLAGPLFSKHMQTQQGILYNASLICRLVRVNWQACKPWEIWIELVISSSLLTGFYMRSMCCRSWTMIVLCEWIGMCRHVWVQWKKLLNFTAVMLQATTLGSE